MFTTEKNTHMNYYKYIQDTTKSSPETLDE